MLKQCANISFENSKCKIRKPQNAKRKNDHREKCKNNRVFSVSTNVGTCLEVPNTKFQFMVSVVNKACAVEGVLSAVNKACAVEVGLNWLADYYVVTNCFVPPAPACCNLEGHLVCNFKQFI